MSLQVELGVLKLSLYFIKNTFAKSRVHSFSLDILEGHRFRLRQHYNCKLPKMQIYMNSKKEKPFSKHCEFAKAKLAKKLFN